MSILAASSVAGEAPLGPCLSAEECDHGFVEAVGQRIAIFGDTQGRLECWMWPLLLFHDLELSLRKRDGERIALGSRSVDVVPEGVTIAWESPVGRLSMDVFASPTERYAVMLFTLSEPADLVLEVSLVPALRPMWPAGLGGQIFASDQETGALLLTEEIGRFAALIGSPDAEPLPDLGDRGARRPVTLRIPLLHLASVERPARLVLAGAAVQPAPLSDEERRGGNQSATGFSRAQPAIQAAHALWLRATNEWQEALAGARRAWRGFLDSTATLQSSDTGLDTAFLWSKIAIQRSWVHVEGVGRTIIAGYGSAKGGERPGLAWFFNGDAFEACRALAPLGDIAGCRDILRFAANTQGKDGKIAHEVTLSAGLCDWFGDFPYAYYKGNQTPEFVAALEHYVAWSGDLELAAELWPAVRAAIQWGIDLLDEDGLLPVPLAGIAAVEAGPLAGKIHAESFLQGSWMSALQGALSLAEDLGESADHQAWKRIWTDRVAGSLGRLTTEVGRAAFARLDDGSLYSGGSVYSALPRARGFGQWPAGDLACNAPSLVADWGARMFAEDCPVYDPQSYNTGSVFPFLTQYTVLALFATGHVQAAWPMLRSQADLLGIGGPACMPEFLAGDRAVLPERSVPHQVFSYTAVLLGVLQGLAGLQPKGRHLVARIAVHPDLEHLRLAGLRFHGSPVALDYRSHSKGSRRTIDCDLHVGEAGMESQEPAQVSVVLPPGSRAVEDSGIEWRATELYESGAVELSSQGLREPGRLQLSYAEGPVALLPWQVTEGESSRHPRLVAQARAGDVHTWVFSGRAGSAAEIEFSGCGSGTLHTPHGEVLIGASSSRARLAFPKGSGYAECTVTWSPVPSPS